MQIFKATVTYWDTDNDKDQTETVLGFALSLSEFGARLEKTFSYIDNVEIAVINSMACENELLYLNPNDSATITSIINENDY